MIFRIILNLNNVYLLIFFLIIIILLLLTCARISKYNILFIYLLYDNHYIEKLCSCLKFISILCWIEVMHFNLKYKYKREIFDLKIIQRSFSPYYKNNNIEVVYINSRVSVTSNAIITFSQTIHVYKCDIYLGNI